MQAGETVPGLSADATQAQSEPASNLPQLSAGGAARANMRQAGMLLSMIDDDDARAVLRRLDPLTAHRLLSGLAQLGAIGRPERIGAVRGFLDRAQSTDVDSSAFAARLRDQVMALRAGFGALENEDVDVSLERLALLDKADPNMIWRALSAEMPQTVALVARHLAPANVARLLTAMPENVRGEVVFRMASQRQPTMGALRAFARATDRLLGVAASGSEGASEGHMQFVADAVSQLGRNTAQEVISAIRERDEDLAEAVEQGIFSFMDVLHLSGAGLQVVLRNAIASDLALALKGVSDELREVVYGNLSRRARAILEEEIALLGPVPTTEAERAQNTIVQIARGLDAAGEISFGAGEVQYVE